ncbi:MAG: thiol-disulfide isomerase/thioredoxin [Parasphingorhabdus sp.]|jgi:thiol-disulfide isomerase/thioredoxin
MKLFAQISSGLICLWFSVLLQAQEIPPLSYSLTVIDPPTAAPALALPNLDDEIINLKDLHGKVILINFWASWCPPCKREMPSLERLSEKVADYPIEILTVNIGEDFETIFGFTGSLELDATFNFLMDEKASTLQEWGVKGLPTSYVVNKTGQLSYRAVGGREFDHPDIISKLVDLTRE